MKAESPAARARPPYCLTPRPPRSDLGISDAVAEVARGAHCSPAGKARRAGRNDSPEEDGKGLNMAAAGAGKG